MGGHRLLTIRKLSYKVSIFYRMLITIDSHIENYRWILCQTSWLVPKRVPVCKWLAVYDRNRKRIPVYGNILNSLIRKRVPVCKRSTVYVFFHTYTGTRLHIYWHIYGYPFVNGRLRLRLQSLQTRLQTISQSLRAEILAILKILYRGWSENYQKFKNFQKRSNFTCFRTRL